MRPETDAGIAVSVRFQAVYGFVDEYGDRWHWERAQVVCNPFVVNMLIRRGAPVEIINVLQTPIEKIGD